MAAGADDVPLTRDATLLVLAGGRSRRMGQPKHALRVRDGTLLDWIVARLGPSFAETIVCGAPAPAGAREVRDRVADGGPVAGIDAGLSAIRTPSAFVLACDTPRASEALAALLLARLADHDAAIPHVGGRDQPTCAAFARAAAPKVAAFLDAGERRVSSLVASLDVKRLDEAELGTKGITVEQLADIDTPAQYEAFVASLRA